jgi:hypothetical protein
MMATAVLLAGILVPGIAAAHGEGEEDQVVLTGRLEVGEGEEFGNAVIFDGPVIVDGEIHGNVVAANGSVLVSGLVEGDVHAFNGPVTVTGEGRVDGDVFHRGDLSIEPGGVVAGTTSQIGVGGAYRRLDLAVRLGAWLAASASVLALGLLLLLLVPRGLDAASAALSARPGGVVGLGAALLVGIPVAAVLVLLTVLGIPLGVAVLLALALIYVTGYTVAAWLVGRRLVKEPSSRWVAFLAGWGALRVLSLIPFVAALSWLAAAVVGLGAAGFATWRARAR